MEGGKVAECMWGSGIKRLCCDCALISYANYGTEDCQVFWAPLSMLSNVKMKKTSIGRVLYHITIALIRALVDRAISKEAHVLVSKRAHFFRVSPISV